MTGGVKGTVSFVTSLLDRTISKRCLLLGTLRDMWWNKHRVEYILSVVVRARGKGLSWELKKSPTLVASGDKNL